MCVSACAHVCVSVERDIGECVMYVLKRDR